MMVYICEWYSNRPTVQLFRAAPVARASHQREGVRGRIS
jgi:hypothetical protein